MTLRTLTCLLVLAGIALPGTVASAQDKKTQEKTPKRSGKGPAFTKPPEGDLNFELMGEFVGEIADGDGDKTKSLALQLRPLAGDTFQAISYFGGLPGEKNHQPALTKMIGQRSGDFLVLSGGPWAVFVEKDGCLIVDRTGKNLGRLERVNRVSPTMGALPPNNAVMMFDGSDVDHFTTARMTKNGLLMEGADFDPMFQDFNIHVEFRLPYMPQAEGQQRGNSGLYLQSRYECQVLDSFGTETMVNGLGALYMFKKPDLNMSFPPLAWQTYDIQFTAPRWSASGKKLRDAHITLWINGVKVQDDVALPNKTGAGKEEEPLLLPIRIQNHGDPVRFRNVWVIDRGLALPAVFPVLTPTEGELKAIKDAEQKVAAEAKAKAKAKADKKAADKKKADEEKAAKAAEEVAKAKLEKAGEAKADQDDEAKPVDETKKSETTTAK